MKKVPVLQTARLIMRGITEEDTRAIITLRSDPDVYKYFVSPHQITEEEHLSWFKNNYIFNEDRFDWIAFDMADRLVGVFGVKRDNKDSKDAEVSYILDSKQYGKGYASEAVNRLIQFCREEWKCVSLIAEVHKENMGSIRFAERIGFLKEETEDVFIIFKKDL